MTSRNEVKPVQVSEKKVRNMRRNSLIASAVLALVALWAMGVGIWGIIICEAYTAILATLAWILVPPLLWLAFACYRDYKGTAWMKAFWEDDWK